MKNNLITFEFKKGILVIDIKFKIRFSNFFSVFKKIYNIQSKNEFKFVAIKFKDGETNVLLLCLLRLYVSKINGHIIILNENENNLISLPKYYIASNINYIFDIFSTIV